MPLSQTWRGVYNVYQYKGCWGGFDMGWSHHFVRWSSISLHVIPVYVLALWMDTLCMEPFNLACYGIDE